MTDPDRCTAKSKTTGEQCRNPAMLGAPTCRFHGSAAPQVQRKARLRLMELVSPAIATLAREMAQADKPSDRLRAAENVLDRAGHPRKSEVTTEDATELLYERLMEMREELLAETADTEEPT